MFRNSRENQHRDSLNALKPSTGRAPSPQLSSRPASPPPSTLEPSRMASKTALPTLAPRKPPTPRSTSKVKTNGPKNGNIMSFFKKQDPLFVDSVGFGEYSDEDTSYRVGEELKENANYREDEGSEGSSDRFNEKCKSSKRRRILAAPLADVIDAESLKRLEAASVGTRACSPPSYDFDDRFEKVQPIQPIRRIGPFEDDSEGEDETLDVTEDEEEDFKEMMKDAEVRNPAVEGEPVHWPGKRPPDLIRESTSYPDIGDFAGFEGMEDFDDEYNEGDEFVEKRWQMQERRRELEEQGFEGDDFEDDFDYGDIKEEETTTINGKESAAATCPLCNASFAGVSDQEASVHVNHCLDGNPTPLPEAKTLIKSEPPEDTISFGASKFKKSIRSARPGQENPFTLVQANGSSSAFSKLMSGHAEDAAWATAAAAEHAARGKPAYQRTCPFYKILPGFNICVDAFRYGAVEGCKAYFLSHFHSDHYIGLTGTWNHGPIYCSRPTANLVRQQLRVDPQWVVDLEFEQKFEVPGTNGVFVTMVPANHCPGSSLYLFEKVTGAGPKPKTQRVLHCGDFRACPAHVEHPLLKPDIIDSITGKAAQQKIDVCYLDTTYLNPKYAFPSQEDVIQACADMCVSLNKTKVDKKDAWEQTKAARAGGAMTQFIQKANEGKEDDPTDSKPIKPDAFNTRGPLLVVVGTYSIGKERICLGIARALDSKIYAPAGKQRICAALEDAELNSRLTRNPREAQVHMTPLFDIRAETLGDYLAEYNDRFSRAVGFRPSGWNYRPPGNRFTESPSVHTVLYSDNWKSGYNMRDLVPQRGSNSRSATYGVPYSEHSSFRELTMFCCALRIERVIPTVNVGSAKSREKMKMWVERWNTWKRKEGLFEVGKMKGGDENGKNAWYAGKGTWELRTTL